MSNIKLKGATSGESIIKAPAVAGSDTTITLPKASIDLSTAGTDGQFLKTDGAGTLSFATVAAGGDISFGGDTFGADKVIGSNDNYALSIETNGSERLKVTNAGVVELASGTGIKFHPDGIPSASVEANTLWDYEIGSFTCTMGNSVTLHSGENELLYVKIGHLVHIHGQVRIDDPNGNGTKHLYINNLPFTNSSPYGDYSAYSSGQVKANKSATGSDTCGVNYYVEGGNTQVWFYTNRTDNSDGWMDAFLARENGYIGVDLCYFTTS